MKGKFFDVVKFQLCVWGVFGLLQCYSCMMDGLRSIGLLYCTPPGFQARQWCSSLGSTPSGAEIIVHEACSSPSSWFGLEL